MTSSESSGLRQIFLSKADVGQVEIDAVTRAVSSDWIAPLGPEVDAFEEEVAAYVGARRAVALSSGTAALHLLLIQAGATKGTTVPTSTLTFAATANAIAYTGATPHFVDAKPDGNIDPGLLIEAVDSLQADGHVVPAVVAVDIMGRCCDYPDFEEELNSRGVLLIADAAESMGASCDGRMAGSFGMGSAISFNGNKIMTTSGGGMLVTNSDEVADRARYLATQARQPVPWYEHTDVGYNYRLSNILAALGRAQLSRLDDMIARRREIRRTYEESLLPLGVRLLGESGTEGFQVENCWLTTIELPAEHPATPESFIAKLASQRIEARHLWKPMHLQPVFHGLEATLNGESERLFRQCVTIPSGSGLTDDDVNRVIAAINEVMA
ncbi:Putative pyridoxal phosphate-dependent aminotransferase EpsN [Corynebacterium atrinae]|uniref:DegT/DnrJ/EryC1/StrS family aminotransferase n=1 Tax=Corynebacterium atrinae TaxID=1336740 RepID=UPI0025B29D0B|nr:DegT/DnrJ/EryC1/StrS aminotransferase family protein [Corynebacterium atrinae]WJY64427.1 Putative pyridoxal phosphate-dependent aminotransferase EpsN [Corynebacterium atrinae]